MTPKYWIESLKAGEGEEQLGKALISTRGHGECIRVYGNEHELTERATVICKALNDHEREKAKRV